MRFEIIQAYFVSSHFAFRSFRWEQFVFCFYLFPWLAIIHCALYPHYDDYETKPKSQTCSGQWRRILRHLRNVAQWPHSMGRSSHRKEAQEEYQTTCWRSAVAKQRHCYSVKHGIADPAGCNMDRCDTAIHQRSLSAMRIKSAIIMAFWRYRTDFSSGLANECRR